MRLNRKVLLIGGAGVALAAGGAGIALGTGNDDGSGEPITGSALAKAKAAALAETGGGTVTATEVRDEEGFYEVEVRSDSGQVDVHLDRNFNVIDSSADGSGDGEGAGDGD